MDIATICKRLTLTFLLASIAIPAETSQNFGDFVRIEEHPHYVVFRSKMCKPASESTLRHQLGAHFDGLRMASTQLRANALTHRRRRSASKPTVDQRSNRKHRRKRRSSGQLVPPWECHLTHVTRHNRVGVFPQFIMDGRCDAKRCFYKMYVCEPVVYSIKVLEREMNRCNVIPRTLNETVYEEKWNLVTQKVTVGCKCVFPSGTRQISLQNVSKKIANR